MIDLQIEGKSAVLSQNDSQIEISCFSQIWERRGTFSYPISLPIPPNIKIFGDIRKQTRFKSKSYSFALMLFGIPLLIGEVVIESCTESDISIILQSSSASFWNVIETTKLDEIPFKTTYDLTPELLLESAYKRYPETPFSAIPTYSEDLESKNYPEDEEDYEDEDEEIYSFGIYPIVNADVIRFPDHLDEVGNDELGSLSTLPTLNTNTKSYYKVAHSIHFYLHEIVIQVIEALGYSIDIDQFPEEYNHTLILSTQYWIGTDLSGVTAAAFLPDCDAEVLFDMLELSLGVVVVVDDITRKVSILSQIECLKQPSMSIDSSKVITGWEASYDESIDEYELKYNSAKEVKGDGAYDLFLNPLPSTATSEYKNLLIWDGTYYYLCSEHSSPIHGFETYYTWERADNGQFISITQGEEESDLGEDLETQTDTIKATLPERFCLELEGDDTVIYMLPLMPLSQDLSLVKRVLTDKSGSELILSLNYTEEDGVNQENACPIAGGRSAPDARTIAGRGTYYNWFQINDRTLELQDILFTIESNRSGDLDYSSPGLYSSILSSKIEFLLNRIPRITTILLSTSDFLKLKRQSSLIIDNEQHYIQSYDIELSNSNTFLIKIQSWVCI